MVMSVTEALATTGPARKTTSPMVNLTSGGMNGQQANYAAFYANTDYISRKARVILLTAPEGWDYFPDGQAYIDNLKAIVEVHAQSWEGFTSTLSVASEQSAMNGAGEQQHTFTKVTREPSVPVLSVAEKYGLPVLATFRSMIEDLMMHPENELATLYTLPNKPRHQLPNIYTFSILVYEPDPTFQYANRAQIVANMYPQMGPEDTMRFDRTAEGEKATYSITFNGFTQRGRGVLDYATKLIKELNITNTSPELQPAMIQSISEDVRRGKGGFAEYLAEAQRTYLR